VLLGAGEGLHFRTRVRGEWDNAPRDLTLVPFADAGATGSEYRVWLRAGL